MEVNVFRWICASLPILAILVLMIGFKWSASKAGPIGFFCGPDWCFGRL